MTSADVRIAQCGVHTDAYGIACVPLRSAGIWYIKFINMVRAIADTRIDYQSKTFRVR